MTQLFTSFTLKTTSQHTPFTTNSSWRSLPSVTSPQKCINPSKTCAEWLMRVYWTGNSWFSLLPTFPVGLPPSGWCKEPQTQPHIENTGAAKEVPVRNQWPQSYLAIVVIVQPTLHTYIPLSEYRMFTLLCNITSNMHAGMLYAVINLNSKH